MDQMSPYMALNESLIMRRVAERHPSQVQIVSSTGIIPATGPHERLGNAFHGGVLFDLSSEFLFVQRCAIVHTVQRSHPPQNRTKRDPRQDAYTRRGYQ